MGSPFLHTTSPLCARPCCIIWTITVRNCVVGGGSCTDWKSPLVLVLVAVALVGNMYYQQSEAGKTNSQWGLIRRTTLGFLTSPTRELTVVGEELGFYLPAARLQI